MFCWWCSWYFLFVFFWTLRSFSVPCSIYRILYMRIFGIYAHRLCRPQTASSKATPRRRGLIDSAASCLPTNSSSQKNLYANTFSTSRKSPSPKLWTRSSRSMYHLILTSPIEKWLHLAIFHWQHSTLSLNINIRPSSRYFWIVFYLTRIGPCRRQCTMRTFWLLLYSFNLRM